MAKWDHAGKLKIIDRATINDQDLMVGEHTSLSRGLLNIRRQFQSYYFVAPPLWKILLRSKSKQARLQPSFLSLGAVRTGTSLLSDYIMQHPCVALPLSKEIGLGMFPMEKYVRAQFPTLAEAQKIEQRYGKSITGFCSPVVPYAAFPHLSSKITDPQKAKVILLLRNPIERTFAHWRWDCALLKHIKADPLWSNYPSFDEAMDIELNMIAQGGGGITALSGAGGAGYIQHSIYLPFLQNLEEFYPKKNILIIQSEEFFAQPLNVAQKVYQFLELPDYQAVETKIKNAGPVRETISDVSRSKLEDFFKPRNESLYQYIGKDFGW